VGGWRASVCYWPVFYWERRSSASQFMVLGREESIWAEGERPGQKMEGFGTIWACFLEFLLQSCLIMLSHRVNVWRPVALHPAPCSVHVGMLEGESRSAGPLTDWHKSAESTTEFEVVMTKHYQLLIISMPSGNAVVPRYILRTKETPKLHIFNLLLVV